MRLRSTAPPSWASTIEPGWIARSSCPSAIRRRTWSTKCSTATSHSTRRRWSARTTSSTVASVEPYGGRNSFGEGAPSRSNRRGGSPDLLPDVSSRQSCQHWVRPGVVADLVARGQFRPDIARKRAGLRADDEEGGVSVIAREDAQHRRRPARVGPVVEAEGDQTRANGDPVDGRAPSAAGAGETRAEREGGAGGGRETSAAGPGSHVQ